MKINKLENTNIPELQAKVVGWAEQNPKLVEKVLQCEEVQALGNEFSDWEEGLFFVTHCMRKYYSLERASNEKTCIFCGRDRVEVIAGCVLSGSASKEGIRTFTGMRKFETGVGTVSDCYLPTCRSCLADILFKRRITTLVGGLCFFLLFPGILGSLFFGGQVLLMNDPAPIFESAKTDWVVFIVSLLVVIAGIVIPLKMKGDKLPTVHNILTKKCFGLNKVKLVKLKN